MFIPLFGFLPSIAVNADPQEIREHCELIAEAAGLGSLEKLRIVLGIDPGQWNRQLNGDGHVSLTRIITELGAKDPRFYPRYAWLLACRYGVPEEAQRSAELVMGLFRKPRAAKMAVEPPQRREA